MALPKYKTSKSNTRTRRSSWKARTKYSVECPNCGSAKLPHRICKVCGVYKGEQYVTIKEKKKEE